MQSGDIFPSNVSFSYVPIDLASLQQQSVLSCDVPIPLSLDKVFDANKTSNVLFVSVPGAFTPTCTEDHIPPFLKSLADLKAKQNITAVIILSANDPFVINAWGKLLLKESKVEASDNLPKVYFASDPMASFSADAGLSVDVTAKGMGIRTARYALVVNGETRKVAYLGKEAGRGVSDSGVDAVLSAKL